MTIPASSNTVSVRDLRQNLSDLLSRANYANERVVVTRRDRPVAALVPVEDLELLEELETRVDIDEVREALSDYAENGGVRWQDLKNELAL